ncbi:TetR family transcriptional regulator [Prauserella sp. PE36]|uniref:TetR/AcrR family transcriptional regulator n=1 Tax=Prauserella endophytica TaxID=1592324 RepID=A0ABY2S5I4_9PSEU|nr:MULTISPECIES: TetR family transcriptional regulator [Prauserella]PXY30130.1 TetR family transcriptional regulator [Prauserella coralliicola]RBM22585.1 TetR family transcriptional regulator [Prauserella sp. PE36]TKG71199.1 TetR/AcrR family transcriptional regulator [Prauserella endophytica]
MTVEGRTWAGTTLTDRRAMRRRQLLDAGLDLLGSGGSGAVSVRAVCRQSKLTERYFYENFADRDELILAVYEGVVHDAHRTLVEAVDTAGRGAEARAEAAVTAFVTLILDDPRKGRVLLLAPLADPALNRRGTERIPMFAELVREQLSDKVDEGDRAMTATALVGGLANLFTAYLGGSLDVSRERLIAHCVRLVLGANALHS